jgi:hypothetical protein
MIIEGACECLGYLAAHTDAMRQQLVDQYAVETLVGLLGSQSADSSLLKSRLQLTAGPPVEQSIRRGDGEGENSGSEGQEGDGEEEMKKEMKKRRKEEEKDVNNHAAAVDRLIAATARTVAELTKGHEGRQRLWRGEGKKLGEEMYDGVIQLVQVSQRYTELCFGSGRPSQEEVKGADANVLEVGDERMVAAGVERMVAAGVEREAKSQSEQDHLRRMAVLAAVAASLRNVALSQKGRRALLGGASEALGVARILVRQCRYCSSTMERYKGKRGKEMGSGGEAAGAEAEKEGADRAAAKGVFADKCSLSLYLCCQQLLGHASEALANLALLDEGRISLVRAGVIDPLLSLCKMELGGTGINRVGLDADVIADGDVLGSAAGALANLAVEPGNRVELVLKGAVPILSQLCRVGAVVVSDVAGNEGGVVLAAPASASSNTVVMPVQPPRVLQYAVVTLSQLSMERGTRSLMVSMGAVHALAQLCVLEREYANTTGAATRAATSIISKSTLRHAIRACALLARCTDGQMALSRSAGALGAMLRHCHEYDQLTDKQSRTTTTALSHASVSNSSSSAHTSVSSSAATNSAASSAPSKDAGEHAERKTAKRPGPDFKLALYSMECIAFTAGVDDGRRSLLREGGGDERGGVVRLLARMLQPLSPKSPPTLSTTPAPTRPDAPAPTALVYLSPALSMEERGRAEEGEAVDEGPEGARELQLEKGRLADLALFAVSRLSADRRCWELLLSSGATGPLAAVCGVWCMEQESRQKKAEESTDGVDTASAAGAAGTAADDDDDETESGKGGDGDRGQSSYAHRVRARLQRKWQRTTTALLQQWWIKLRCTSPLQGSPLMPPSTVAVTTTAQACHGATVLAMLSQQLPARRELLKDGAVPALLGLLDHCYLRYGNVCVGFGDDLKPVSKREMMSRARAALQGNKGGHADDGADSTEDSEDDEVGEGSSEDAHDAEVDQYDVDVTIRGVEDGVADYAGESGGGDIRRQLGGSERELVLRQRALLHSARAVSMLALSADCRRAMVEHGAVKTLCALCSSNGGNSGESAVNAGGASSSGTDTLTNSSSSGQFSDSADATALDSRAATATPSLIPLPPPVLVHIAAALGQLAADGRAQLVLVREGVAKVLVVLCRALVYKLERQNGDAGGDAGGAVVEAGEEGGSRAWTVEAAAASADVASTLSHVTQAISGLASGAATRVQLVNTGVLRPVLQLCTILTAAPKEDVDSNSGERWQLVQQQLHHHHQATLLYAVQSLSHLANEGDDERSQLLLLEQQVVRVLIGMLMANTSQRLSRRGNKGSGGIDAAQGCGGKINSTVLHLIVEILLSLARVAAATSVDLITVAIPITALDEATAGTAPGASYEWSRQQPRQQSQSERMVRRHPLMVMCTEGALGVLDWLLNHDNGESENSLVLSGALQMVAQLALRADVSTTLLVDAAPHAVALPPGVQTPGNPSVGVKLTSPAQNASKSTNVITLVLEVLRRGATVGLDVQCDACAVLRNIARHGGLDGTCVWGADDEAGGGTARGGADVTAGATKIAAAAAAGAEAVGGAVRNNQGGSSASLSHRQQLVHGGVLPRLMLLLRLATGVRYDDVEAIAAERLQGVTSAAAATAAAAKAARTAKATKTKGNFARSVDSSGYGMQQSMNRGQGGENADAEAVAAAVVGLGQEGREGSDSEDDAALAVTTMTMGDSNATAVVDPEKISAQQWRLVGMAAAVVANVCVDGVCARQAVSHFDALILLVQVARTALGQWQRRRQQQDLQRLRIEQQAEEHKRQAQSASGWASSFWQPTSSSEPKKTAKQSAGQFLSQAELEESVAESDADMATGVSPSVKSSMLGGAAGVEHVQSILTALRHTSMAIANVCEHAGGRVAAIEIGAAAPLIEILQQHMHAHIAHEEQERQRGGPMDEHVHDHQGAMHALRGLGCLACEAAGRLELVHSFPQTIAVLMQLIVIGGPQLGEAADLCGSSVGGQGRLGSGFGGAAAGAAAGFSNGGDSVSKVGWSHLVCGAVMVLHHMAEDIAYRTWLVEKKVVKALVGLCVTTHEIADADGAAGEDGSNVVVTSAIDGPALVAATLALSRFAEHDRTHDVLVPGGVMWFSGGSALINIISEPTRFQPRVLAHAAAAIGVLAMDTSSRPELMELGVSRPLVKVSHSYNHLLLSLYTTT